MAAYDNSSQTTRILDNVVRENTQSAPFSSNDYSVIPSSKFAMQLFVTNQSGLTATVKIQGTLLTPELKGTVQSPVPLVDADWADFPGSTITVIANGNYVWDDYITSMTSVRMNINISAGSANFDVLANRKF